MPHLFSGVEFGSNLSRGQTPIVGRTSLGCGPDERRTAGVACHHRLPRRWEGGAFTPSSCTDEV